MPLEWVGFHLNYTTDFFQFAYKPRRLPKPKTERMYSFQPFRACEKAVSKTIVVRRRLGSRSMAGSFFGRLWPRENIQFVTLRKLQASSSEKPDQHLRDVLFVSE